MTDRLGLIGLAVFIIAIMGLWTFLFTLFAVKHRDNPIIAAGTRFWPG